MAIRYANVCIFTYTLIRNLLFLKDTDLANKLLMKI
jgi:hypothetical protein